MVENVLKNISFSVNVDESVSYADLVIEAILENIEVLLVFTFTHKILIVSL